MTQELPRRAAADKAHKDLQDVQDAVKNEAAAAHEAVRKTGDRIRSEASDIADKAKDAVSARANEGKETVAAGMTDFAAAVRKASDELGERDQSMAANLVREVAGGLEDAANSIKGQSIQDMTRSVTAFARRQPTAFLLGAAIAGMALGRFAKATEDRPVEDGSGATPRRQAGGPSQTSNFSPANGGFNDR